MSPAKDAHGQRGSGGREPIRTSGCFGELLPELRDRLKWSQADLGKFFGVSKISAHRWEKRGVGETEPRKAALRLLASVLEHSPPPDYKVGQALLDIGVAGMVVAGGHRSPHLGESPPDDSSEGNSPQDNSPQGKSPYEEPLCEEFLCEEPLDWRWAFGVRDRLGWTQAEFAAFLGVTHSVPAVWESPGGSFDEAVWAALLALGLASDPSRPAFPPPETEWDKLKTKGLSAFYKEVFELEWPSK